MSARNPFPTDIATDSLRPCALWDFCVFRPFLWDVWEIRGDGLTNLQLSTYNFQPFFPKLLGLILLIPFTTSKNYIVIAIAILTITLAAACA